MTEFWKQCEGQIIDRTYRLQQLLDGDETHAVFLAEYGGRDAKTAAMKVVLADASAAEAQLRRWNQAAKLSHPNLVSLLATGQCQLSERTAVYALMDYAEEDLSKVLPHRPLSVEEAREVLEPTLSALGYLHAKGFVHGHVKPSNFMAVDGKLRLSSDGLCKIGECRPAKTDSYSPPEVAAEGVSPAGDIWSLGVTLVEALTQRQPTWNGREPRDAAMHGALPEPFADIVRHCLQINPQSRWTVGAISKRLKEGAAGPEQPRAAAAAAAHGSRKWVYLTTAVLAIVLVVMVAGPRLNNPRPTAPGAPSILLEQPAAKPAPTQPAPTPPAPTQPAQSEQRAPAKAQTPAPTQAPPATPPPQVAPPQATPPAETKPSPFNSEAKRAPATPEKKNPPATPPAAPPPPPTRETKASAETTAPGVVNQIVPEATAGARRTIHGKVTVIVKLRVDPAGNVTDATFDNEGPSKYFSQIALDAARKWKFTPGDAPSDWSVRFQFFPTETKVFPTRAAR